MVTDLNTRDFSVHDESFQLFMLNIPYFSHMSFEFQGNEMEEKLLKKDDKINNTENGVKDAVNIDHSSKSPPEETGQETILDLFRWSLILIFTIISSLL